MKKKLFLLSCFYFPTLWAQEGSFSLEYLILEQVENKHVLRVKGVFENTSSCTKDHRLKIEVECTDSQKNILEGMAQGCWENKKVHEIQLTAPLDPKDVPHWKDALCDFRISSHQVVLKYKNKPLKSKVSLEIK